MQGNILKATAPVGELDALASSLRHGNQLLGLLRAEGGPRGIRLAGTLSSLKDVDLSVVPDATAEAIVDKIAMFANATENCVGEIAVMARTWQQAFPGLSDAHLKETVDSYFNDFQSILGASGLAGLGGIREAPGVMLDNWRRAVDVCPEVPATRAVDQMDEGGGDSFPEWFVGTYAVQANLQPCLTTFCSGKSSAAFLLMPPAARILYMRCAASLAGKDHKKVLRWFRLETQANPVSRAVFNQAMELYALNACSLPDGGESNLWRHARRMVYLLTTLVCIVCALNTAFDDTHLNQPALASPWHDFAGLAPAPNHPGARVLNDKERTVGNMFVTTEHGAQERWHLNAPGVIPLPPGTGRGRGKTITFGRPSEGGPNEEPPAQRARVDQPVRVALTDNQLAALASMATERRPLGCLLATKMSPSEALNRAKNGACLLCLQNGHRATHCQLRTANPKVVNSWFNRYRGKVQALRDGLPMPPLPAAQPPKQD
jgi:hypothetical protein